MYMTHTEFYDKLNNSRRTTKGEKETPCTLFIHVVTRDSLLCQPDHLDMINEDILLVKLSNNSMHYYPNKYKVQCDRVDGKNTESHLGKR